MASQISTTLAHSYNSRGELGSFVNPEICSCSTCVSVVGLSSPPLRTEDLSGSWVWSAATLGTGAGASLQRSATGTETPTRQPTPSLAPPPPLRRAPSFQPPPQTPRSLEEEEEDVLKQLASLRAALLIRQDRLYEEEAGSHSDMALQDTEWSELDEKIAAVESLLSRFRYPFRTR